MKKLILFLCILFPVYLQAQNFDQAFEEFQKSINQQFNTFQDSINAIFAKALEQQWQEFQVFAKIPSPIKPSPKTPPVVDPEKTEPAIPVEIPIKEVDPPKKEEPKPEDKKPEPQDLKIEPQDLKPEPQEIKPKPQEPKPELPKVEEPKPQEPKPEFPKVEEPKPIFPDTPPVMLPNKVIKLWNSAYKIPYDKALENLFLTNTQEKNISDFWLAISRTNYQPVIDAMAEIQNRCALNHYGLAVLCHEYVKTIWANKPQNETTILLVFLLNQLSLDAKIVRTSNRLEAVVHSPQTVYGASYMEMNRKPYFFLFSTLEPTSIYTYKINFSDKITGLDFNVNKPVNISNKLVDKELLIKKLNKIITLTYSQSAVDYYKNYPQINADVNANAAVSDAFKKSVMHQFKPLLSGKTESEAVDILLNFMHYAFEYKTDDEQFGYEKWNFCEETLFYPYNDCDDRAILFSYLVRTLLNLDVVLVLYSDHMSTAVHFTTPVTGDYLTFDGRKYVICDPTYIGATVGMNSSRYKNEEAEIVKTKKL